MRYRGKGIQIYDGSIVSPTDEHLKLLRTLRDANPWAMDDIYRSKTLFDWRDHADDDTTMFFGLNDRGIPVGCMFAEYIWPGRSCSISGYGKTMLPSRAAKGLRSVCAFMMRLYGLKTVRADLCIKNRGASMACSAAGMMAEGVFHGTREHKGKPFATIAFSITADEILTDQRDPYRQEINDLTLRIQKEQCNGRRKRT